MDPVLEALRQRLDELRLPLHLAARQMGVTVGSLERHLAGEYVCSDSLAKYRAWLADAGAVSPSPDPAPPSSPQVNGRGRRRAKPQVPPAAVVQQSLPGLRQETDYDLGPDGSPVLFAEPPPGAAPYLVVDLFSGCGGMSLGFDLFAGDAEPGSRCGTVFQTVLVLDIEPRVVRLQNENHPQCPGLRGDAARWLDLADFRSAAEVLCFYLDHLAQRRGDSELRQALDRLPRMGLGCFKDYLADLDRWFLTRLDHLRAGARFRHDYARLDSVVLGQTSVIGFHDALALPATSTARAEDVGPLAWATHDGPPQGAVVVPNEPEGLEGYTAAVRRAERRLAALWQAEVEKLRGRTEGRGRGQLASSAKRIGQFLEFLSGEPMGAVRALWLQWRSRRDAVRELAFDDEATLSCLRGLYSPGRRVDVLLGGPPCQGFSRIGRGKIRSLRDDGVHVEADPEAGDVRNRLMHQYVLCVSALEPRAFLFENVRHFQAEVKTPEGTFRATDILNEAIHELSHERLSYRVSARVIDCSRHGIPQTRERYVLAGVRADVDPGRLALDLPSWCLTLPPRGPVPLRAALAGLPTPRGATNDRAGAEGVSQLVPVDVEWAPAGDPAGRYVRWVRQAPPPGMEGRSTRELDGHYIRVPRRDDATLFELLGPGQRWMDYRCDASRTLSDLRELLGQLAKAVEAAGGDATNHPALRLLRAIDPEQLARTAGAVDGSLSIRMLPESIPARPRPRRGRIHGLRGHVTQVRSLRRRGKSGAPVQDAAPYPPGPRHRTPLGAASVRARHPTRRRAAPACVYSVPVTWRAVGYSATRN
jgi:site-specific DNA-cytosine methylase